MTDASWPTAAGLTPLQAEATAKTAVAAACEAKTLEARPHRMSCAQRLKRVSWWTSVQALAQPLETRVNPRQQAQRIADAHVAQRQPGQAAP